MHYDNSAAHNQLQKPFKCEKKSSGFTPEIQFAKLSVLVLTMVLFLAHTVFAQSTTWQGDVSSDWHTPGNWSNGVPTQNLVVWIYGVTPPKVDPVISSAANAKYVLLRSGGFLTISTGGTLDLSGSTATTRLDIAGSVENNGTLLINAANGIGLNNTAGSNFTNKGTLVIGNAYGIGSSGISNNGTFVNESGIIRINQTGTSGGGSAAILNSGSFINKDSITIGELWFGYNGANGIWNEGASATFQNQAGGVITIDRIARDGLINQNSGVFTNQGTIQIGSAGDMGGDGINTSSPSTFNNSACTALINIVSNNIIRNSGTITNAGTIIENANGNSSISSNTGVVQNLNGGTFTIDAGTAALTAAGAIWRGCTSTAWNRGSNWHLAAVPKVTDDVTIPDATINPVISALNAVAKSVTVETGGGLTIQATGGLTIYGSAVQGILNKGTVTNNGLIKIGLSPSMYDYGIRNEGIFTHNAGLVQVENTKQAALYNVSGAFVNKAALIFKALSAATPLVISDGGTISNNATGTLSGTGTISPTHFINNGGILSPGYSPGTLTFEGSEDFTRSTMVMEVNEGRVMGQDYDLIVVNGTATLGGNLALTFNFPAPGDGDFVVIIDANAISGTFSSVTGLPAGWTIKYDFPSSGYVSLEYTKPLPVTLIRFTAKKQDNGVKLDWQTSEESNNQGFDIERKHDGENWENVGYVDGHGSTKENSTYSFLDVSALSGMNYYRLRQIDFDGRTEYFRIVGVKIDSEKVVKIYPNPTTGIIHIEGAQSNVKIMDILGRPVMNGTIINQKIDVSHLPGGFYMLSVFSENKEKSIPIVKQ